DRLGEPDAYLALDVGATTSLRRAGAGAEQPPEHVTDTAGTGARGAGTAEQVAQIEAERPAGRTAGTTRHPESAAEQRPRFVVLLALARVGQHGVGLRGLLEPGLGGLV